MNYRDLEAVRQIVNNATGLDITYAYEDLVFPENGAFIIRFDDNCNDKIYCHFHDDCLPGDEKNIYANIASECAKKKCTLEKGKRYQLEQVDDNIQFRFL